MTGTLLGLWPSVIVKLNMHRSIAGHNPYNPFILTIVYSKNFTTSWLLTTEHMAMFVVKSIHIQIYGQVMDLSIFVLVQIYAF